MLRNSRRGRGAALAALGTVAMMSAAIYAGLAPTSISAAAGSLPAIPLSTANPSPSASLSGSPLPAASGSGKTSAAPTATASPRPASSGKKKGPRITASPASGFSDGQFIKLTMAGLPRGYGLAFRQCIAAPSVVATDCTAVNTDVTFTADSKGGGSTYVPVYAGSDLALTNAARSGSIRCDATHPCVIAAMNPVTSFTGALLVPLSFAPSPDACPAPGPDAVLGSGSASAYRAIYAWESAVCLSPSNLSVGYTVNNSPDGVANFLLRGLTDYAVTGPLPPPAPSSPTQGYRFAPLTASAVVLAYRMYDQRGPQITTLTLTPALVAQIFLGQIPNFAASPQIKALNPNIHFPPRANVFARAEHSSNTYAFTSWLAATAPDVWKAGAQTIFPSGGATGTTTSDALGRNVVDPKTVFFDEGNIGFMDSTTAAFYGLPSVRILRPDGSIVAATPDSIQRALADATVNADGTITPNYATSDPLAYPIPMVTYMMAPTNNTTGSRGTTLAAFLKYAVQAGQQNLPAGYVPLPAALVNVSLKAAAAIPLIAPAPSPSPTGSASPTPSSSGSTFGSFLPAGLPPLLLPPLSTSNQTGDGSGPGNAAALTNCPAPSASACPAPVDSAAPVALLVSDQARFVLPAIVGLCLLGLLAGVAIQAFYGAQALARRRRGAAGRP